MDNKKFYRYGKHFNVESCIKRKAERIARTKAHVPLGVYVNNESWSIIGTSTASNKDVLAKYYLPEIGKGILFSVIFLLLAWIIGGAK